MFKVKIFNDGYEETRHCSTLNAAQAIASIIMRERNNAEVHICIGNSIIGMKNACDYDWVFPELSMVR